MAKPQLVQRVEYAHAIQALEGDEESLAIIRGWVGAPIDADLKVLTSKTTWVLKERDSQMVYLVDPDTYLRDFIQVDESA